MTTRTATLTRRERDVLRAARRAVRDLREAHAALYPQGMSTDFGPYDEARADIAQALLDAAITAFGATR